MYIRITKNSRGDAYYHLVESYRHEGKVRQRVLLSLGRVEEGRLEQLAHAISKHLDRVTALNLAESIDISQAYLYGPLLILEHLYEKLGIGTILFGIITNVKKESMSSERIISEYKQLWRIEDAFGELKGTFKTRPMFHWTDERIMGHIMVCFLAYFCEAHLTKSLREKDEKLNSKSIEQGWINSRSLTVVQGMKELNQVLAIPVKVRKQILWVRTDIQENAMKLLRAMNMKIPPKILKKEEM